MLLGIGLIIAGCLLSKPKGYKMSDKQSGLTSRQLGIRETNIIINPIYMDIL